MISLVIPTYNEAKNIRQIIIKSAKALSKCSEPSEIIVVDDNSSDGTGHIVQVMKKLNKGLGRSELRLCVRKKERDLSTAVLKGFSLARGSIVGVIDADLSHNPELIPRLVEPLQKENADISVGSRYVKGGGVKDWPVIRKGISRAATLLARLLTPVKDPMSGYFFIRKAIVQKAAKTMKPKGYKILLELLVKTKHGPVTEVPYIFNDRVKGTSKIGSKVMLKYVTQLWDLYWYRMFHFGK